MDGFDPLGYGTHLILDGFRADAALLGDADAVDVVLRAIGAVMHETGTEVTAVVHARNDDAGVSAALVAAESQLCLHTFAELGKLSLEAFSTRSLATDAVMRAFVERFRVGRFECRLHGRGRFLPKDPTRLERALEGERAYARLRLRDLLGG